MSHAGNGEVLGGNDTEGEAFDRCAYPGCRYPRKPDTDLCAKYHSRKWSSNDKGIDPAADRLLRANDGLVDEQAIEIAVRGSRKVRMTWVERDIAAMQIMAAGHTYYEAARRTGMPVTGRKDPKLRGARARRLAELGRRHFGSDSDDIGRIAAA